MMNNKNLVWLDRFNQFYSMPNTVEEYNFEQSSMNKQLELEGLMKDCIRVGGETLTIDKNVDVKIRLNVLKDSKKFRKFKRDMASVLNTFFDGDYVKRVFNMLDEQIGNEGKRVVNLKYHNHSIKDKKLIISYTVITRSEMFNNVIQLPLVAEPFEVCDE